MLKKILFNNKKIILIISVLSIIQNVTYIFSFFWIYLLLNDLFLFKSKYILFFEKAGISILFLTISIIVNSFWKFLYQKHSLVCAKELRKVGISNIINLKPWEFDKKNISFYISKNTDVVQKAEWYYFLSFHVIFNDFIKLLSISFLLIYINWLLALFTFINLVIFYIILNKIFVKLAPLENEILNLDIKLRKSLSKKLSKFSIFYFSNKIGNLQKIIYKKLNNFKNQNYQINKRKNLLSSVYIFFIIFYSFIIFMVSTLFYFLDIISINLATILSVSQISILLFWNMTDIFRTIHNFKWTNKILDEFDFIDYEKIAEVKVVKIKSILLENITLNFNDKVVLNRFNLEILNNQKIAVTGASGVGKSTLAKIISGWDIPYQGTIIVNKKKELVKTLWKNIYYLDEKGFVFSGTIKENITLFDEIINNDKLSKILNILDLKHLDASRYISFHDKDLSDGEKQRLALARALYSEKNILILDESLSKIQDSLRSNIIDFLIKSDKRTILFISHHFNQEELKKFNKVLRLKND